MAFAKEKHLRKGERKRGGMIELEQYLANYLLNTSRREVHHKYPGNNNYNRKYPFAVEQMTYEESAIIHNKVDHEQYVQQTVDEILARSLRRISAMTIQKAWRIYKGRDTQLYFANLVKAAQGSVTSCIEDPRDNGGSCTSVSSTKRQCDCLVAFAAVDCQYDTNACDPESFWPDSLFSLLSTLIE